MQKYQDSIVNPDGTALAGVTVRVQTYPGGVDATIYSDDGVTTKANPMTTDSLGAFSFYAADGRYQLVISGPGITARTVGDVVLGPPPALSGEFLFTNNSGGTFTAFTGRGYYVKQGPMVWISGVFYFNTNSSTAEVKLGGLPFPMKEVPLYINYAHIGVSWQGNLTAGDVDGYIIPGTSEMRFRWRDSPGAIVTVGHIDQFQVGFSGWYPTDS